jgi:hypothetical protein
MNLGSVNRVHHAKGKIDAEAKSCVIMTEFADILTEQPQPLVLRK